jgi:hypothetical protein
MIKIIIILAGKLKKMWWGKSESVDRDGGWERRLDGHFHTLDLTFQVPIWGFFPGLLEFWLPSAYTYEKYLCVTIGQDTIFFYLTNNSHRGQLSWATISLMQKNLILNPKQWRLVMRCGNFDFVLQYGFGPTWK